MILCELCWTDDIQNGQGNLNALARDCINSIANALELLHSWIKTSFSMDE